MNIARPFWLLAVVLLAAPFARGEQYWVSYEGNDYPENEGWTRQYCDENGIFGQGGAIRSLEDGALVLDSLRSVMIVDAYRILRPIDPGPGELFVMRWRLKIGSVPTFRDPGIGVFADSFRGVSFEFSESQIVSGLEQNVSSQFEARVFHVFELRSPDMSAYELSIDGDVALAGRFMPIGNPSRVFWGDVIQGGASVAHWDYVEFGVVPEPASMINVALAGLAGFCSRNRLTGPRSYQ